MGLQPLKAITGWKPMPLLNSLLKKSTFKENLMNSAIATQCSTLLAVYPDHDAAENAVKLLQKNGMKMDQLSIVGQDFKTIEKPIGFLTTGSVACDGARVGAWTGGFFGILAGAAFLIVPGIGPLVIAGPLAATLLGGIEGAIAGSAVGALTGAVVSLGFSKNQAIRYESQIKAGKFLVTLKGDSEQIEKAKRLVGENNAESVDVVDTMTA
jgi:hypothetical protein